RASPQSIADYDNRRRAGFVLIFSKRSADLRPQADYAEEISRHCRTGDAFRIPAGNAAQVSRFLVSGSKMFENGVIFLPVEIVGKRDGIVLSRSRRFVQHHDAVRVGIRQRTKQYRVDDT